MKTPDSRGIECDFCGKEFRDKFTYFSGEAHKVDVDKDRKQVVDVDRRFLDYDMCGECFTRRIKKPMLKVIKEREENRKTGKGKWS